MLSSPMGRRRAVLEIDDDGEGDFRLYVASKIRVISDTVYFEAQDREWAFARQRIRNAVEVNSGHTVPNLCRYKEQMGRHYHNATFFWDATAIMSSQAAASSSPFACAFAHFSAPEGDDDPVSAALSAFQGMVRWYDLLARLDESTAAILLPGCAKSDAEIVSARLSQISGYASVEWSVIEP